MAWPILALLIATTLAGAEEGKPSRSAAELMDVLMWNREPIGGAFELIDQAGRPRRSDDFRGKLLLVYFGFTSCPDICPTDLQEISLALDRLGADAAAVQPLFITVDPDRDTPAQLADYLTSFHPSFVGLTGSAEAIRRAADAYKVYVAKVATGSQTTDYTVDHSAFIYLMDRNGGYLGFFPPGTPADRLIAMIRPRLADPPSR